MYTFQPHPDYFAVGTNVPNRMGYHSQCVILYRVVFMGRRCQSDFGFYRWPYFINATKVAMRDYETITSSSGLEFNVLFLTVNGYI